MIALVSGSRKILSSLSVATWGPARLSGLIRSSLAHLCQDDDTSSISFVGTRPWATDSISARCRDSAVSWTMPIIVFLPKRTVRRSRVQLIELYNQLDHTYNQMSGRALRLQLFCEDLSGPHARSARKTADMDWK